MDGHRRRRAVRSWPLGQGILFGQRRGARAASTRRRTPTRAIDLKQLVDRLQLRGIDLPILIRFTDILKHRLGEIHDAFAQRDHRARLQRQATAASIRSRSTSSGTSSRRSLDFGKPYSFGLEAGSKPELLAVVAMTDDDTPIICNGFKDDEFIEMAMLAQKIGQQDHPGRREVHRAGADRRSTPRRSASGRMIGMRVKLAARGRGRWQSVGRLPLASSA